MHVTRSKNTISIYEKDTTFLRLTLASLLALRSFFTGASGVKLLYKQVNIEETICQSFRGSICHLQSSSTLSSSLSILDLLQQQSTHLDKTMIG